MIILILISCVSYHHGFMGFVTMKHSRQFLHHIFLITLYSIQSLSVTFKMAGADLVNIHHISGVHLTLSG